MKTEITGGGARSECAARYLINADLPEKCGIERIRLLPIPSTRDGVYVSGTELPLSSLPSELDGKTLLVGYGLPKPLRGELAAAGIPTLDVKDDESFVLENARLTALGALCHLVLRDGRDPRDTSYGVIGYGRIGSQLVRMLLFFGARVTVFTTSEKNRLTLGELGIACADIRKEELPSDALLGLDVLVNTAPTELTYLFPDGETKGLFVCDLASGDSFPGISGVEYLPSVPSRLLGESAGLAYGRAVERYLSKIGGGV